LCQERPPSWHSRPEHVRRLRDVADGVIVGSALVRHLEQAGKKPLDQIVNDIGTLAASLAAALED
jgi:tryptophan synthase alpha chain